VWATLSLDNQAKSLEICDYGRREAGNVNLTSDIKGPCGPLTSSFRVIMPFKVLSEWLPEYALLVFTPFAIYLWL
jgi:hypothetical protein